MKLSLYLQKIYNIPEFYIMCYTQIFQPLEMNLYKSLLHF